MWPDFYCGSPEVGKVSPGVRERESCRWSDPSCRQSSNRVALRIHPTENADAERRDQKAFGPPDADPVARVPPPPAGAVGPA